jgi:tRNA threonylcarbamoyl adenosine modification protein (Sua5/YciO/YrdC/YwlC family)
VAELKAGRLAVVPTDTVYGVAALVHARGAIAALFAAKGRPDSKALPVLADGIGALADVVTFDPRAEALAERFWPGPLTIVLPRAPGFDVDLGGDGGGSVAVRVPDNDIALDLLARLGPLAVSSANRSGDPSVTTLEDARTALGHSVSVFVDGGRLSGRPSTIVSLLGELSSIREGDIAFAKVQSAIP